MNEWLIDPQEQEFTEKLSQMAGRSLSAIALIEQTAAWDELAVEDALDAMTRYQVALDVACLPPAQLTGSAALRLKQEAQSKNAQQLLTGLDENDPLRLYLQELAQTPAAGDVEQYAQRYLAGEHHLAEPMVTLCLSLVVEMAMAHTGHGVLLLDLIQEGSMGLWESLSLYEGGCFTDHARWHIRQAMARAVFYAARAGGVGQRLREDMQDYTDTDQRLLVELGRNPTVEEIAQQLQISVEACAALEKMVSDARNMEKNRQQQQEPEPTQDDEQAVEDTAYFQLRQRITELLSSLPAEDAKLLRLRFGLEGGKPLSPVQTGELLGLTPQEVVSREAAALDKLRND